LLRRREQGEGGGGREGGGRRRGREGRAYFMVEDEGAVRNSKSFRGDFQEEGLGLLHQRRIFFRFSKI
jgi:hypothetical protein